jgi:uncharacterized membrane protein YidH (DUF202 family)
MDAFIATVQREILDPIITLLALGAFILFAVGIVEFLRGADNEEKRATGQRHMIWALIGLAVLFGARTIVEIMQKIIAGIAP